MFNFPLYVYKSTWIWRLFNCSHKEVIIIIKQNNFPSLFRSLLCALCCRFLVFFHNYSGTKHITSSCRSDGEKQTKKNNQKSPHRDQCQSYWKAALVHSMYSQAVSITATSNVLLQQCCIRSISQKLPDKAKSQTACPSLSLQSLLRQTCSSPLGRAARFWVKKTHQPHTVISTDFPNQNPT